MTFSLLLRKGSLVPNTARFMAEMSSENGSLPLLYIKEVSCWLSCHFSRGFMSIYMFKIKGGEFLKKLWCSKSGNSKLATIKS